MRNVKTGKPEKFSRLLRKKIIICKIYLNFPKLPEKLSGFPVFSSPPIFKEKIYLDNI